MLQLMGFCKNSLAKRKIGDTNLRSCAMGIMLQTPINILGHRAFLAASPKLWNGLPSQIRNEPNFYRVKGLLKTHFFRLVSFLVMYMLYFL